eukprot:3876581-Rhodomonas_salina.1
MQRPRPRPHARAVSGCARATSRMLANAFRCIHTHTQAHRQYRDNLLGRFEREILLGTRQHTRHRLRPLLLSARVRKHVELRGCPYGPSMPSPSSLPAVVLCYAPTTTCPVLAYANCSHRACAGGCSIRVACCSIRIAAVWSPSRHPAQPPETGAGAVDMWVVRGKESEEAQTRCVR